ncbi:HAD-superfamily phosphatase, subfamily IIIC/FkbH-like domain-containing protein [Butyrivibrio fibrisolvens]|uniref:HAD-superfamily phosphatase, subfamily IIIC/FkbH-like domain-containing protein n=1 Tax=Butyrivibrio fibrisolvens TaxID=831 RepID=A0A1H9Q9A4_BUTFI|nr:HAD-IIIC family phosphatase [Butyrivibrio fibrisolvens]SER56725.1 HAD-superfamily phosphatase, subfamily IIIC/FkbH-like domain-containing protein [Butyrivibrio fibrisolvens]
MQELEYPFDGNYIMKKSKSLKKTLLADGAKRITKKIAVLGGSTTHDIIRILELFLLNYGIEPIFYESEYGQYYQDAFFPGEDLSNFKPDIIYIHTSNRNIKEYPTLEDSDEVVETKLNSTFRHFESVWQKLNQTYHCPIIQNNFEAPFFRLLGNRDVYDIHGRLSFINRLNEKFSEYARKCSAEGTSFFINDINYLSSCYGLDEWSDPMAWHMYKYALCIPAIPTLSYNIANIIKSIFGKNKKGLVLDLDNTLWGGVIGDDGVDGIEIGQETNLGQVYLEFQDYIKMQKDLGIVLTVDSKNERENALAGLNHPAGKLKEEDFVLIKANWDPKSENLKAIAAELNVLPESLVFVDDNPAEREIVKKQLPGTRTPEMDSPEHYIRILDHSGFFEATLISEDDKKRNEMYKANIQRASLEESFSDYGEYLKSLEMTADIAPFEKMYMPRIAQLTNKSNQFNLTTKRYTQDDIEQAAADQANITLYGRLKDKFGDNGIVSLVIGNIRENSDTCDKELHIDLWLMSCRVLKRDMEFAMMDALVAKAKEKGITTIYGYYYPTAKNKMVKDFYLLQGFEKDGEDEEGNATFSFRIPDGYENKNKYITSIVK